MRSHNIATGSSLLGAAILAACACGSSSKLAQLDSSFGSHATARMVHPIFVGAGAILILGGLWQLNRRATGFALGGLIALGIGEYLVPPMSITALTQFSSLQLAGLAASLAGAILLVTAFFRAFPSRNPGASLTAMSGAAMATGCECCLVTMGITGISHAIFPSQAWLPHTLPVYLVATLLMAVGLTRLGGITAAGLAVAGQIMVYFWLELPYDSLPRMMLHGVNINFAIKYPMLLVGSLVVMSSFVLAYRAQESLVTPMVSMGEPAMAGD